MKSCCCVLLLTVLSGAVAAQDDFHTALDKSLAERAKITSFDFRYKMRDSSTQKTTAPNDVPMSTVSDTTGHVQFDEVTTTMRLFSRKSLVSIEGGLDRRREAVQAMFKKPVLKQEIWHGDQVITL